MATAAEPAARRATAFGLGLEAWEPLPEVLDGAGSAPARTIRWRTTPEAALVRERVGLRTETLRELRHPDGRLFLAVGRDPNGDVVVAAPGYGTHVIDADASTVVSGLPSRRSGWQRLLTAQVLPVAAALSGLEPFHASAVAVDGRAIALVGPSGAGKSSLAAHLRLLGAELVTDDVLALDAEGRAVRAHTGAATATLDPREADLLTQAELRRLGRELAAADRKRVFRAPTAAGPLPLGALVFLHRDRSAPTPTLEPQRDNLARALLGAAFLGYLQLPERLANHLALCSRLASSTPAFALRIPAEVSARETAAFVLEGIA